MNNKDIFMSFYKAETENEVSKLIQQFSMNKLEHWKPYGGSESNFSVIGNQSSNAERALIEKFTNSVDAVLMKRCYEKGIDPKGKEAPKSPKEALESFFYIKDGETSNINKEIEKELGKNILLMATSEECKSTPKQSRYNPNMTIFDKGEGQSPSKLQDTILSLLKGNKKSIPFTQGNYNQGGSGALMYCGENGYCLVVSKRNTHIERKFIDYKDKNINYWGWTLIRKEIRENAKDPVYTYYAPNGQVPIIIEEELELLPKELKSKESKVYLDYDGACKGFIPYKEKVNCGTAIKLYNYKLAKKGPVNGHLKYDLAAYINDTYLPIRFVDCRKNKGSNNIYFRGFKKIIEEDMRKNGEANEGLVHSKINFDFKVDNQEVLVHIYCCNKKPSSDLTAQKLIEGSKPVKFCLGQQFQGGLTGRFLNNSGLGAIQNLIIMIVEFPNISTVFRSDLFMTDRERLYDKKPKKSIEIKLKDFINKSEELREFRKYIIKSDESNNPKDNKAIREIMEEWIEKDPTISEFLMGNNIFNNNSTNEAAVTEDEGEDDEEKPKVNNPTVTEVNEPVETKYMPTYFTPLLRINKEEKYIKPSKIDKSFRLRFKTDANENFFIRLKDKGDIKVKVDGKETTDFSKVIKNGKATLIFSEKVAGKKVLAKELRIILLCNEEELFESVITLNLKEDKNSSNPKNTKDSNKEKVIGLPKYIVVDKDNWIPGMDEESAVYYVNDMGNATYYINIDNNSLKEKLNTLNEEVDKEVYKQMYTYIMLFMSIGINRNNKNNKINESLNNEKEMTIEDEIKLVTKEYAKFMFISEKLMDDLKKKLGEVE